MKNLKNKVIVITGAASGIGKALATVFLSKGCHLALNDFNEVALQQVVAELKYNATTGQRIESLVFDVSDRMAMQGFADFVVEQFGQVDVVINNAGVALGRISIAEVTYEDFEWVMNINFWGMVYGTKAFLPLLRKQKEAAIVNISSVFGLAGIAYQGPYCSSKFAIRGFTESLRMEASIDFPHVTIHSVHPGGINTNIAKSARWNDESLKAQALETENKLLITPPLEIAQTIAKRIEQKKVRIVTGHLAKLLDRLVRFLPSAYTGLIAKRIEKENS
ncbi:MAG: SDR family oxidoreductase [Chitinophagales bacterium]